jgi:hypothetical protein
MRAPGGGGGRVVQLMRQSRREPTQRLESVFVELRGLKFTCAIQHVVYERSSHFRTFANQFRKVLPMECEGDHVVFDDQIAWRQLETRIRDCANYLTGSDFAYHTPSTAAWCVQGDAPGQDDHHLIHGFAPRSNRRTGAI